MAPNSLFAVLLRSPWWISFAIAVAFAAIARFVLPPQYVVFGAMGALPFVVIGCMAGWRQFKAPSAKSVATQLEAVQAMSWRDFAAALEAAFMRDGYTVEKINAPAADLLLTKGYRTSVVSAKRWKAASVGVEALRDLDTMAQKREAQESIYVTLGTVSDNAAIFARENSVRLLQAQELAVLLSQK